jgi:hypothetical protein
VSDTVIPQPPSDQIDATVVPDPSQAPVVPTGADESTASGVATPTTSDVTDSTVPPAPSSPADNSSAPSPAPATPTPKPAASSPSLFVGQLVARDYEDPYSESGVSTQLGIIVNSSDNGHQVSWLPDPSGFIAESELRAL